MEKKEEDDDSCDGSVQRPLLILSKVKEPEEQRNSNCNERKEQIHQQVDVDVLRSLVGCHKLSYLPVSRKQSREMTREATSTAG